MRQCYCKEKLDAGQYWGLENKFWKHNNLDMTQFSLYQDVAHVGLASILLREGQLDDTAVVIKKALEVSNLIFKCLTRDLPFLISSR